MDAGKTMTVSEDLELTPFVESGGPRSVSDDEVALAAVDASLAAPDEDVSLRRQGGAGVDQRGLDGDVASSEGALENAATLFAGSEHVAVVALGHPDAVHRPAVLLGRGVVIVTGVAQLLQALLDDGLAVARPLVKHVDGKVAGQHLVLVDGRLDASLVHQEDDGGAAGGEGDATSPDLGVAPVERVQLDVDACLVHLTGRMDDGAAGAAGVDGRRTAAQAIDQSDGAVHGHVHPHLVAQEQAQDPEGGHGGADVVVSDVIHPMETRPLTIANVVIRRAECRVPTRPTEGPDAAAVHHVVVLERWEIVEVRVLGDWGSEIHRPFFSSISTNFFFSFFNHKFIDFTPVFTGGGFFRSNRSFCFLFFEKKIKKNEE